MLQTLILLEYIEKRLMHSNKAVSKLCKPIITFTAQDTSLMWLHAGSYAYNIACYIATVCIYVASYTLQNEYLNLTKKLHIIIMHSYNCMDVANM